MEKELNKSQYTETRLSLEQGPSKNYGKPKQHQTITLKNSNGNHFGPKISASSITVHSFIPQPMNSIETNSVRKDNIYMLFVYSTVVIIFVVLSAYYIWS